MLRPVRLFEFKWLVRRLQLPSSGNCRSVKQTFVIVSGVAYFAIMATAGRLRLLLYRLMVGTVNRRMADLRAKYSPTDEK